MELEKVAAAAFLDEVSKLLGPSDQEKLASIFHEKMLGMPSIEDITAIIKEAGFFDRMKSFVQGGTQNGIPMHSLGSQLAQSNPMQGMGSSLASSARQAGGAIAGKLQGAAGAVGNFLRGGEQNGIPMHSLAGQLRESNPMQGMGANLAQGARDVGGAISGAASGIASKARAMWNGGQNAQGIPMMGAKQTMQAMNPGQGMMGSLKANVPAALAGGGSQLTRPQAPAARPMPAGHLSGV